MVWMLKEVALSNLRTLKAQQVFRLSSRRNQTILSFKLVIKRVSIILSFAAYKNNQH